MTYSIIRTFNNQIACIRHISGIDIPPDESNLDYQQYLVWLAEGNTPEEWQPES